MNERLEQEIYNKIDEIDSKHNGTSWDEEDLILFAQALYKLALEDVKNKVEENLKELNDRYDVLNRGEIQLYQRKILDFIKELGK